MVVEESRCRSNAYLWLLLVIATLEYLRMVVISKLTIDCSLCCVQAPESSILPRASVFVVYAVSESVRTKLGHRGIVAATTN